VRRFDSFGFIHCVKIAYISSNSTSNHSKQNGNKYYKDSTDKHNYANQDDSDLDDDDDDICYKVSKTSLTNNNKHRVRDNLSDQDNEDYYEWFNVSVPSLLSANHFIKVRYLNLTKINLIYVNFLRFFFLLLFFFLIII
jgi:hypothetical protein